jgi:hypothetical protein
MHADPDDRKAVLAANLPGDPNAEANGVRCAVAADHDRIADAFDHLGVFGQKLANGVQEHCDEIRGVIVAVGLCQRREPGHIGKQEGVRG